MFFFFYVNHVRLAIQTNSTSLLATGGLLSDYTHYLQQLCNKKGIGKLPSSCDIKKLISTRSSSLDDESQQLLAKHMCHSSEVHRRYNQAHTTKRAICAHSIVAVTTEGNKLEIVN